MCRYVCRLTRCVGMNIGWLGVQVGRLVRCVGT